MNYAMVGINRKETPQGEPVVRRVLIRYEGRPKMSLGCKYYNSVKLLAVDPYFQNENASHKYVFEDDGYRLLDCQYELTKQAYKEQDLLGPKRQYHTLHLEDHTWLYGKPQTPIIFKAKSDEEAIKLFHERIELR